MTKKLLLWPLFALIAVSAAVAQNKQITIADIYESRQFSQKSVYGINWMKDGRYYSSQEENDVVKYDVTTGEKVATIVAGAELSPKIDFTDYSFSADEQKILFMTGREAIYRRSFKATYYVYDLRTKQLTALSSKGKQSYATFSPDGSKVAFVRENNLFMVELGSMAETQITTDGKFNYIINGSADWVYEEEFSFAKAFFWSPDSRKIAYYRFDESAVKEYNMQLWNETPLYPTDYRFKYPKAGESNSAVGIFVYHLADKKSVKIDIGSETDVYVPRVTWTKNANLLSIKRLNRLQNKLQLIHANATNGMSDIVLTEEVATYVDTDFCDDLTYLEDGERFIHSSEKSGFKHLYLYKMNGELEYQITSGNWEVDTFLGVDEKNKGLVYYTATEVSAMERHLYVTDIKNGKKKELLTPANGYHTIDMSADFSYYIDYFSSATQPRTVTLFSLSKGKNELVKELINNKDLEKTVSNFGFATKEFFQCKAADGATVLNGYVLKPKNMSTSKKYPLLMFQYSGPGSQQVLNSWGGSNFEWHQMLVQQGYLVAVVDGRGTGGRGKDFKHLTYKQLGKIETEDQIAAAQFLGRTSYIDETRIGIWGWSYGGYMSSLALMKGAETFKAAIAVAPVTTWRFYDTVYTERYLQRPQDNASGYDDNSPISHVDKLKGKFLLIHGTGDDNVHFQNAVVLQNALIKAGKQFDSFYYPDRNHGIYGGNTRSHLFTMMTSWVKANL